MNEQVFYKVTYFFKPQNYELFVTLLTQFGITSFEEKSHEVFVDFPYDDPEKDLYKDCGENDEITCYFNTAEELNELDKFLTEYTESTNTQLIENKNIDSVRQEQWDRVWQKNFSVQEISPTLKIIPIWEEVPSKPGVTTIRINPGQAFGTGEHETTRMCLQLMEGIIKRDKVESFLDVGTGSGILSILASKLGVSLITGIDIDELAIEIAKQNAAENSCGSIQFGTNGLDELTFKYDLICANMISSQLKKVWKKSLSLLRKDGVVIVSGILREEKEQVLDFIELKPKSEIILGEWVAWEFIA